MGSVSKGNLRAYAACLLAWTVVGIFFFSQGLTQKFFSHDPTPWWHYLVSYLIGVYISALSTPVILWLGRTFSFSRQTWLRRILQHLSFSLAFGIFQIVVHSFLLSTLKLFPMVMKNFVMAFVVLMAIGFHQSVLTYWLVLGIQYAFRYYRQYREREQEALRLELHAEGLKTQLVRAQLSALKNQLQPHFLFNTLNAIMVLVRQQRGHQAEEMLGHLSDLLRCLLEDLDAHEVPLRREFEYLQLYLSIEQVRFQDRLYVENATQPDVLNAAVPHMVLQPIVENAIRHGIGRSSSAGKICISARRINTTLEIQVQDDGPGLPANFSEARGIGLSNTRARLTQLYGDTSRLTIENGAQGGAVVTMVLPYHLADPTADRELTELDVLNNVIS
jgi:two-component system, LytTR family, sensor kinase